MLADDMYKFDFFISCHIHPYKYTIYISVVYLYRKISKDHKSNFMIWIIHILSVKKFDILNSITLSFTDAEVLKNVVEHFLGGDGAARDVG